MIKMNRLATLALIVLTALAFALPSNASAGVPMDRVKFTTDKVISILNNQSLKGPSKTAERRKAIRSTVSELFDFSEMAKRSLATYWRERSAGEKKEFTDLYADLLERSYINRIENYSGEKISYDTESAEGEYAVVKTRFITKRGEEIPVDYKLLSEGGKWSVYDVVIESVSLVNNYRIQFNKVIRSSSYAELLKKMKNKQESESFEAPSTKPKGKTE